MEMKSSVKHEKASEQLIWDMACRHLKKVLSEREISQWLSGYELRNIEEDKAVLLCRNGNCKGENQEKYLRELEKSLSWAAGKPLQLYIEMAGSHAGRIHRTGKKKNCLKKITVAVILMVIFGGLAMGAQTLRLSRPHKTFYRIVSDKMEDGFRIVLLSDLKGSSFGDANEELLESVCTAEVELTHEKLKELPPHHFSRSFERKMKWLFWRRTLRYDTILNSTGKKVAAFLLCFLLLSYQLFLLFF